MTEQEFKNYWLAQSQEDRDYIEEWEFNLTLAGDKPEQAREFAVKMLEYHKNKKPTPSPQVEIIRELDEMQYGNY